VPCRPTQQRTGGRHRAGLGGRRPPTATKATGRPRRCDSGDVNRVLRELVREGRASLTIAAFVREIAGRVACSRRTAYRALRRACDEGTIRLPGY
jgi:hypothetical protein